jgi:hypothetical protein
MNSRMFFALDRMGLSRAIVTIPTRAVDAHPAYGF